LTAHADCLAVECTDLDDAFARLDAVGARIHAQRPTDGTGDAVVEMKAANAVVMRQCCHALVGVAAPALIPVGEMASASPKPFADSRTTKPGMPPSRTRRLEPIPTTISRDLFRHRLQEGGEIFLVGRLEQQPPPDHRRGTR
jgi:hypothetical protein